MNASKVLKLQYLLINQLLSEGTVELILPDGITLEIGITQETKKGNRKKADDYCYVVATRGGKSTILDSYNLGLQYEDAPDTIVYEDLNLEDDGTMVKTVDII